MKISIVGQGNVGDHLFKAFNDLCARRSDIIVNSGSSRNIDWLERDNDVIIIAVSDKVVIDTIRRVTEHPGIDRNVIIAHTSGSITLEDVIGSVEGDFNYGVLYPLQTFTKGVVVNYSDIPFLIEGDGEKTECKLKDLALLISDNVEVANSAMRGEYHLAAVIACNFSNYLFGLSKEILDENGLNFNMLMPLIRETIEKLKFSSPREGQTGPARRGDIGVIELHKRKLSSKLEILKVYGLLTEGIMSRYLEDNNIK